MSEKKYYELFSQFQFPSEAAWMLFLFKRLDILEIAEGN
jgi:hypothetical protein